MKTKLFFICALVLVLSFSLTITVSAEVKRPGHGCYNCIDVYVKHTHGGGIFMTNKVGNKEWGYSAGNDGKAIIDGKTSAKHIYGEAGGNNKQYGYHKEFCNGSETFSHGSGKTYIKYHAH